MSAAGRRLLCLALLASLALHAALLLVSLDLRGKRQPDAREPIVARLAELPAPPAAPSVAPSPPAPRISEPPRRKSEPRPERVVKPAPARKSAPAPVASRDAPPPAPSAPPIEPAPQADPVPSTTASPAPPSASRAPAEPVAEAKSAPTPADSDAQAARSYAFAVAEVAGRMKRYPRVAVDNGWEGRVVVRVVVQANGFNAAYAVAESSGREVLDKDAVATVSRARPRVPIPASLRGKQFTFDILYNYDLKDLGSR